MDSTLLKGLEVLERIVARAEPVGVSALALEFGLPKSNVHRTLSSLREAGYLSYDNDTRRYYASLKLAQMGSRVANQYPFRVAVLPWLKRLVQQTGESAHFVYRDGSSVIFLANARPAVNMASVLPDHLRLHWSDTAFGIALASALPSETVDELLLAETSPGDLTAQLQAADSAGYALIEHHRSRHIFELAAPVRSGWDTVIGALGITGPVQRFDADRSVAQAQAVINIAASAFAETARLKPRHTETGVGEPG